MPVISAPSEPTHRLPGTAFTSLATPSRGSRDLAVWEVRIEPGTPTTPHELTREEIFVVQAGRARVQLAGATQLAGPGDSIVVPAGTLFAIGVDGDEPLRALCCTSVGAQARLVDGEPFTPPWAL